MNLALIGMIAAPLLSAILSLIVKNRDSMVRLQTVHAAVLIGTMSLIVASTAGGDELTFGNVLRTDALGAFLDLMLAFVGATSLLYALGYMGEELIRGHLSDRRYRKFFFLLDLYLFTMLLAVNLDNVALMWIAIEGSTLAAALLINFDRTKTALEAGWKYIILSFVGIALALFGTVLVYYASEHVLGVRLEALQWSELRRSASSLNPTALELAFIFIVVGYGTKAGIAPMHTWLPDAHAEAPSPISAVLSGLMLNLGIYAVLRIKAIVDPAVGEGFAGSILVALGLLSMTIAATFMLIQRDYKRLFAYSSIEHVGIIMVGFGVGGPAGVFGGLFHMINHALAKSTAFYSAGMVFLRYGHKNLQGVTGLLRQTPLVGGAMLLSVLALAGMPPFGLFISEILIVVGAYNERPWVAYIFLGILSLAFAALVYQVLRMLLGDPKEPGIAVSPGGDRFAAVSFVINLMAMAYIGIHMPGFLRDLFVPMTGILKSVAELR